MSYSDHMDQIADAIERVNSHRITVLEAVAGCNTAATCRRVHNYYRSLAGAERGLERLRSVAPETAARARIEALS